MWMNIDPKERFGNCIKQSLGQEIHGTLGKGRVGGGGSCFFYGA